MHLMVGLPQSPYIKIFLTIPYHAMTQDIANSNFVVK